MQWRQCPAIQLKKPQIFISRMPSVEKLGTSKREAVWKDVMCVELELRVLDRGTSLLSPSFGVFLNCISIGLESVKNGTIKN